MAKYEGQTLLRVIIVPDMVHGIVLTLRLLEFIGLDAPKIKLGKMASLSGAGYNNCKQHRPKP